MTDIILDAKDKIEAEVSEADKDLIKQAAVQQDNEDRRKAELLKLLEHHAAMVDAGKIVGLAIVSTHGPDQISFSHGGSNIATLSTGCAEVANRLREILFKKKPSPIITPGGVQ